MNYNTAAIRELICTAFSSDDFDIWCFDHFWDVQQDVASSAGVRVRAQKLIEYCIQHNKMDLLLSLLRQERPEKYNEFAPRLAQHALDQRLQETLDLYLGKQFKADLYARLDQAGDKDPDRMTLLQPVFVDLEVKSLTNRVPHFVRHKGHLHASELVDLDDLAIPEDKKILSVMRCLLHNAALRLVLIGGPGQGKSTLGQFLAQIHRAILLDRTAEFYQFATNQADATHFVPAIPRTPFRIILKDFAQWLSEDSGESIEAYLAIQIGKGARRTNEIEDRHVQHILRSQPALVIFDGLDEVTEPDLLHRVLEQVEIFLDHAERLDVDLQVVATSRPTANTNQFSAEQFWHLELQPMSQQKVIEYARRWSTLKVLADEQQRVITTLDECLATEHMRLLLTTPLQVSIVLLIIKDGGRPPSQREALFNAYWITILHREKAKANHMIRTDDQLLFDLHAHLGFLLHRRAAGSNTRSLLTEAQFTAEVRRFLRAQDSLSDDQAINQLTHQMVREARDRLVLLVEPEPGSFGFELRSLQEFFAAAYLAQTAMNTEQRFARLKAIAGSEHWHNVALFFAGRIGRNARGEAALLLEYVCRPLDREGPDQWLRRGAWLALAIAADGSFAANRNLQYSMLEYGLTVLDIGLTHNKLGQLELVLRHLSHEDRHDLLKPILEQKIAALPVSCLYTALIIYWRFVSSNDFLIQSLQAMLATGQSFYIDRALSIAFDARVNPEWFASQLDPFWEIMQHGTDTFDVWLTQPTYMVGVLSSKHLSPTTIKSISSKMLKHRIFRYYRGFHISLQKLLIDYDMDDQGSFLLKLRQVTASIIDGTRFYEYGNKKEYVAIIDEKIMKRSISSGEIKLALDYHGLIPEVQAALWFLYTLTCDLSKAEVEQFTSHITSWRERSLDDQNALLALWQQSPWSLFIIYVERCLIKGSAEAEQLIPYLNRASEIEFDEEFTSAIGEVLQRGNETEWMMLRTKADAQVETGIPELKPIAQKLGVSDFEVFQAYYRFEDDHADGLSADEILGCLAVLDEQLHTGDVCLSAFHRLVNYDWFADQDVIDQAKSLILRMIQLLPHTEEAGNLVAAMLVNILVTEDFDDALPEILSYLGKSSLALDDDYFHQNILGLHEYFVEDIMSYIDSENVYICEGSTLLLDKVTRSMLATRYFWGRKDEEINIRLDSALGFQYISEPHSNNIMRGIYLLTFSDLRKDLAEHTPTIVNAIAQAQDDALRAWRQFITYFPASYAKSTDLLALLETILSQPRRFHTQILGAAMERYTDLVGETGPEIQGDLAALGLAMGG